MTLRTALAAALLVLLAGCGDDPEPTSGDRAREKPANRDQDRQDSPAADPSGSAGSAAADTTVAVYYIGDTERAGPRLYREFQRGTGGQLDAAVAALAGDPLDPDYRTAWRGRITAAALDGDVVSVVVDPAVRTRPDGMSRAEARAAVQQVVYTVQAAVQQRAPVQFRTEDGPLDQVFGVPTAEPVANASMLQVLSHVNLTTPEQGSSASDGTLRVSGVGNSFEANLGWEIRRGDEVVRDGFATMEGWMGDKLFPFELSVDVGDLAPGDYIFWVTTDDPTGGTEGVGAMTDDKAFTVG